MSATSLQDRAAGALLGAFIGDALAVGPHCYCDLDQRRAELGPWISEYAAPKPGRSRAGLPAGALSQAGIILRLTAESVVASGGYDADDFRARLDRDLFPLDGSPLNGPGGYTSQPVRETWRKRVGQGLPWGRVAGNADTTEAAARIIALAIRYARQPAELAEAVTSNTLLTQDDGTVVAMTVAYAAILGAVVEGHALTPAVPHLLMARVRAGEMPFHTVASGKLQASLPDKPEKSTEGRFPSPDALIGPSAIIRAAQDPDIWIEPASKAALVYGLACAVYHQFPAACCLAARFPQDFESAVQHAVNGGGQNQARAIVTGALMGALVGLSGIPERFITGLQDGTALRDLALDLGKLV